MKIARLYRITRLIIFIPGSEPFERMISTHCTIGCADDIALCHVNANISGLGSFLVNLLTEFNGTTTASPKGPRLLYMSKLRSTVAQEKQSILQHL